MRGIDRFLDLTELRPLLAPFYSSHGRPSIDPELMIRTLLLGYCMGIRPERRLCEEVHVNLAYRWFYKLDLTDRRGSRPFVVLKEPPWPVSRERVVPSSIRDSFAALHG